MNEATLYVKVLLLLKSPAGTWLTWRFWFLHRCLDSLWLCCWAFSQITLQKPQHRQQEGERPERQGKTALVARPALSLPRERGGWSFPCVKLTASTLALKTLLTILDDTDNPSRPLAVYFLGTLYSDLEPSQPPFIGARVETVPPFYRAAIETFRQLRAHVSKEDIVEAPASRLVSILYSSQFPAPVPGLGPSYIGPRLPHGSLPGEVCDFQWKKALAEWVLWRNRCSSKVRQRCQRAMWPLLWRLRRELVTFLECEFLRRWSCQFLTVINGQVHLACLSLDML
ncbi:hypothetical protein ISCGN_020035 [Ixodes scapularis]